MNSATSSECPRPALPGLSAPGPPVRCFSLLVPGPITLGMSTMGLLSGAPPRLFSLYSGSLPPSVGPCSLQSSWLSVWVLTVANMDLSSSLLTKCLMLTASLCQQWSSLHHLPSFLTLAQSSLVASRCLEVHPELLSMIHHGLAWPYPCGLGLLPRPRLAPVACIPQSHSLNSESSVLLSYAPLHRFP